jgi:hypothetical protein
MIEKDLQKSFNMESVDTKQYPLNSVSTNAKFNTESFIVSKNLFDSQFIKITNDKRKTHFGSSDKLLSKVNYSNMNQSDNMILTLNKNEETKVRRDKSGLIIRKGGKDHKISFKDNLIETVSIESYKEFYNKQTIIPSRADCNCQIF